jgi:hypothetical protein
MVINILIVELYDVTKRHRKYNVWMIILYYW